MVETGTWVAIGAVATVLSVLVLLVQLYRGQSDGEGAEQSAEEAETAFMQNVTIEGGHATVSQDPTIGVAHEGGGRTTSELREQVQELLYQEGRLAEAVMYARLFAEEKGLEEEAQLLRWEQLGIQEEPPPEIEHDWESMAPYRKITVEIIPPQERFIGKPPVWAKKEVFWALSISQVEEKIHMVSGQEDEMIRAKFPLEEMVPPGSQPYRTYPGDVIHFLIPEGELRGIVSGVRHKIVRLLDEH